MLKRHKPSFNIKKNYQTLNVSAYNCSGKTIEIKIDISISVTFFLLHRDY